LTARLQEAKVAELSAELALAHETTKQLEEEVKVGALQLATWTGEICRGEGP